MLSDADGEYDLAVDAKLLYRGELAFTARAAVRLALAPAWSPPLAVAVRVTLAELAGTARVGVRRASSTFSFLHEPFAHMDVRSEIGGGGDGSAAAVAGGAAGGGGAKLHRVPRLEQLIKTRIQTAIRTRLVHPRGREIDHLQQFDVRVDAWKAMCKRRGLAENYPFQTFASVPLPEKRASRGGGGAFDEDAGAMPSLT